MRKFETSHPWLTFRLDTEKIPAAVWILLGEVRSNCEHLAGVPLQPKTAQTLNQVFLAKGARATTHRDVAARPPEGAHAR
jgi:hypothetical protein